MSMYNVAKYINYKKRKEQQHRFSFDLQSCLVVFFNDGKNTNSTRARQFIDKLLESQVSGY